MGKKTKIALGVVAGLFVISQVTDSGDTETPAAAAETTQTAPSQQKAAAPAKKQADKSSDKAQAVPTPPAAPAAIAVDAASILKEFEGNEAAADLKYDGKTLKVTGVVAKVDTEFWDDEQYVAQLNSGDEWDILTVNCNDLTADQAATLGAGATATVVGQFDDGGDLGVELKDCTLAN